MKISTELKQSNLRQLNLSIVYYSIYKNKEISRQQLVKNLNLSLPTVVQNITDLLSEGLIEEVGFSKSTGGRPAMVYRINSSAKVSVGVELLPHKINMAIIDLYGEILFENTLLIAFENNGHYFSTVGNWINSNISSFINDQSTVLGVDIAIPGIIAADNEHIMYSEVLHCTDFTLSDFSSKIDFPCSFMHDAEAGAYAELWHGERPRNAFYFILNDYFSNALILNGEVFKSSNLSSGTLEHLIIHSDGKPCYCGKKGCIDSYISAQSLLAESHSATLDDFFSHLREGSDAEKRIWDNYLSDLALSIDSARMAIACDIVIGGVLQRYMIQKDIDILKQKIRQITTFKAADFSIKIGSCGRKGVVIGAGIPRIEGFLSQIADLQLP